MIRTFEPGDVVQIKSDENPFDAVPMTVEAVDDVVATVVWRDGWGFQRETVNIEVLKEA